MNNHKTKCIKSISTAELRNFGLLVGAVFALIALWPMLWQNPLRIWAITVSVLLILPAVIRPEALRQTYWLWLKIGAKLGWFNTRVILTLLYFGAIMPIGLILKLTGKSPLKMSFDRNSETYRELPEDDSESSITEQF